MIVGIGIDAVEVARMERLLERSGARAWTRLFTPLEKKHCMEATSSRRRAERAASNFALKEAVSKALGTGMAGGVRFRDIEVLRTVRGRPTVTLHGRAREEAVRRGVEAIHASVTHEQGIAIGVVILERLKG